MHIACICHHNKDWLFLCSQARSGGTFALGGTQQPYRTQISLFRMSANGGIGSALSPGATVQLGEELMLRAHVNAGDGWLIYSIE